MEEHKKHLNRREFVGFISIGWIAFTSAIAGLVSLAFRYTFPNVNFEPRMDFVAGKPEDFFEGVDERYKMQEGVWIVREEGKLFALSNICTHLGCIPNWTPSTRTFECPCHGSGYYTSGINFKGPAPRPLERYKVSLTPEGRVAVDKTKVYRYEKGQWNNPNSYIEV
jgi:cytochrome b6-f complex iron-sulfur subunit